MHEIAPIVTIGICARNSEALIGKAIESVLAQDYPHNLMEIVFVDDGSEDKTLSVIKEYIDKTNIRYKVFSSTWKGIGYARNKVVESANGIYIIWVDADNILSVDFVRKQVEFMEKNLKVGIATGMFQIRSGESPVLTLELAHLVLKYSRNKTWTMNDTTKLPGAAGTICRTALLRKIGGFDEQISGAGEDQDVASKIQAARWIIYRNDAVIYETRGNMSTWRDLWRKYVWYGASAFPLYRRRIYKISVLRVNPFAGFVSGLIVASGTYPMLHRKILFLCPIHGAYKMLAYLYGFSKTMIANTG